MIPVVKRARLTFGVRDQDVVGSGIEPGGHRQVDRGVRLRGDDLKRRVAPDDLQASIPLRNEQVDSARVGGIRVTRRLEGPHQHGGVGSAHIDGVHATPPVGHVRVIAGQCDSLGPARRVEAPDEGGGVRIADVDDLQGG